MRAALSALVLVCALPGCYRSHERVDREDGSVPAGQFVELRAGGDHTCARTASGSVRCWGWDQLGQLGIGEGDGASCERRITEGPERRVPVEVSGVRGAVALALGLDHTCALLADGTLVCWGAGCRGQLGDGAVSGSEVPLAIGAPDLLLAVGTGHAHTVAIARDETLLSWGWNAYGQLGIGTTSPLTEPGATAPVRVRGVAGIVEVEAGLAHTCAIDREGRVWCWGANGAGQLGDGTTDVRSLPQRVMGLPGRARALAVGDRFTCAITDAAEVWCWGLNDAGQLGAAPTCGGPGGACDREVVPVRAGVEGAIAMSAGSRHTCVLDAAGRVSCWGTNDVGQLGGGRIGGASTSAVSVELSGVEQVAAGQNHTCALASGSVWCWGRNAQGQLGNGASEDSGAPVRVM